MIISTGYEQDKNGDVDYPEKEYRVAVDFSKVSFVRFVNFKYKDEIKSYCSVVFDNGEFIIVHAAFFDAYCAS